VHTRQLLWVLLASVIGLCAVTAGGTEVTIEHIEEETAVKPKIVDMPEIILVGVADGAPDVSGIDIAALWQRFAAAAEEVEHTIEGVGYELHIQTPAEPCMHFCLVGTQVSEIGAMPPDMFVKVLPAGTYAVFTHHVVEGYKQLYDGIFAWLESSEYEEAHPYDLQLYDSRFTTMDDPESVQDIYVPVRLK